MFTCRRGLNLILEYKVTPDTTDCGKQLSFTLFLLSFSIQQHIKTDKTMSKKITNNRRVKRCSKNGNEKSCEKTGFLDALYPGLKNVLQS